jgi:hypothetical protein
MLPLSAFEETDDNGIAYEEDAFFLVSPEMGDTVDLPEKFIQSFLNTLDYVYSQFSHFLLFEVNSLNNYELPS